MSWRSAFDDKLDLYRHYQSELGRRELAGFTESMRAVEKGRGTPGEVGQADELREALETLVLWSDPIVVEAEMMPIVDAAAQSFQPETFEETDLLTQSGFVRLPEPMFMYDRNQKRISFRAFGWHPLMLADKETGAVHGNGVVLAVWSHRDDVLAGLDDYPLDVGQDAEEFLRGAISPYMLSHATPWLFGEKVPDDGADEAAALSWWTNVQALMRLMMQTVSDRYQERAPRASIKRAHRAGFTRPEHDPYITVIRLRRPRGHRSDEPSTVEWSQRWIVGGHWRNQWFPSLNTHRQIWISGYVKGPDDKPLVVRKGRAFEFAQ